MRAATSPDSRPLALKSEVACYAAGFLALGLVPMQGIAIPLWAVELGASPFALGLAIGMRSLAPLLFAIHGGALIDRLGARAIMLWMGALCVATSVLYPFLPFVSALLLLQLVFGLGQGLSWVGAQTLIGQWTRGQPVFAARLSFAAIMGTFVGPVIAGLAWDRGGAFACFGVMAAWSAALVACAAALPRRRHADPPPASRLSDLLPDLSTYRDAFALMAAPALVFVMLGSFARLGIIGVQASFYPIHLAAIGLDAASIGFLIGLAAAVGAPAALLAGPLDRVAPQTGTLVAMIVLAVIAMTLTPLFQNLWTLGALAVIFGVAIGATQPQVISLLSRSVAPGQQGLSVGLRTTVNRAASFVVPVAMGAIAEAFGLRAAFLIAGGLLLVVVLAMGALALQRRLWAPGEPHER